MTVLCDDLTENMQPSSVQRKRFNFESVLWVNYRLIISYPFRGYLEISFIQNRKTDFSPQDHVLYEPSYEKWDQPPPVLLHHATNLTSFWAKDNMWDSSNWSWVMVVNVLFCPRKVQSFYQPPWIYMCMATEKMCSISYQTTSVIHADLI